MICENCEREIGRLESVGDWQGHKVCQSCLGRLQESGNSASDRSKPLIVTETTSSWRTKTQGAGAFVACCGATMMIYTHYVPNPAVGGIGLLICLAGVVILLIGRLGV
jgi:hypothetical protein